MDILLLIVGFAFIAAAVVKPIAADDSLIDIRELTDGGPPPDGIPSIDNPIFLKNDKVEEWLSNRDPVIVLRGKREVKAYPLQILIWHEIVNDFLDGRAVAVTYSVMSNSVVAMDRHILGNDLEFGTTGKLFKGTSVYYDRQTGSYWLHYSGLCIRGEMAAAKMELLPVLVTSFREYRKSYPKGEVLSRYTGHRRKYGRNPYVRYGRPDERPLLFLGELDNRILPKEKIVGVSHDLGKIAYPYSLFGGDYRRVIHDELWGLEVVVFYSRGTNSPLDAASISFSRDIGSAAVFCPYLEGKRLHFYAGEEGFKDRETESNWSMLGKCLTGRLEGKELEIIKHHDTFWFAWSTLFPETKIYSEELVQILS
ncbi:DUF3179 domain-containing protein [Candidatus Contubernalis alkaliaceticus]|uniref:DUF3179 domain-containing protein n=1 Tax=Candidatus Contubernalis alkaliaceticus TaxID=338645 RepID=UPI001F4C017D|nr:DUF3179 domain-containing protein [Candidatus Contubernalis alkalaceticus]UNC91609.1 DUF3179 domain-containing protein [Candidatus Contubernalis alkalaceticus]